MIVDGETMDLVSAIDEMMVDVPPETEGQVKPELLQSVLEISTDVCRNVAEAAGQLDELRRRVRQTAREEGPHDRLRRNAPVREMGGPADRRRRALPRDPRRARLRRPAGAAVRPPRPRRHRRSGKGDPRRERHAHARPDPARALVQLPVLARHADPADVRAHADLPAAATRRRAAALRRLGRLLQSGSSSWSRPARSPTTRSSGGTCGPHPKLGTVEIRSLRRPDPPRPHGRARGADPGDVQGAVRALRGRVRARHVPAGAARGEQVARGPLRPRRRADRPAAEHARARARARAAPGRAAAPACPRARLRSASSSW